MTSYVVLLYQDETHMDAATDAERAELLARHLEFQAKHASAIKDGAALQRERQARSIHVGDGSLAVTDGPFVETKEALAGYYLIEADDLDAAVAIAAEVPAPAGGVEIRPVMVLS